MKIEQETRSFTPVIITLDSQEEVNNMKQIFAIEWNESLSTYLEKMKLSSDEYKRLLNFNNKIHSKLSEL